jgi:hypothetical protein
VQNYEHFDCIRFDARLSCGRFRYGVSQVLDHMEFTHGVSLVLGHVNITCDIGQVFDHVKNNLNSIIKLVKVDEKKIVK